jgi:hypothetical protein
MLEETYFEFDLNNFREATIATQQCDGNHNDTVTRD